MFGGSLSTGVDFSFEGIPEPDRRPLDTPEQPVATGSSGDVGGWPPRTDPTGFYDPFFNETVGTSTHHDLEAAALTLSDTL